MKKIIKHKRLVSFFSLFLFVPTVPVALGSTNILSSQFKNEYLINGTLLFVVSITLVLIWTGNWKFYDIGFKPKKPFKGFFVTLLLCIAGFFLVGPYARALGFNENVNLMQVDWVKIVKWSFIYAIAQDFMYQSFLSKVGREIFENKKMLVAVDISIVILFIWMHSIFDRPWAVMAFVAPGAIIFKLLYNKYQNVYLVFLIHTFYSLLAFYYKVFNY